MPTPPIMVDHDTTQDSIGSADNLDPDLLQCPATPGRE